MTDQKPDGISPSQTVGPFFAFGLTPARYDFHEIFSNDLTVEGVTGQRVRVEGTITDGDGEPVLDAMIEIWQADAQGRYPSGPDRANTGFKGFGRSETIDGGRFTFTTVKPGQVPGPKGTTQAPHLNVTIFSRGLLTHLFTRIYFEGEAANAQDPILALVPEHRRDTLIAKRTGEGTYSIAIRLQGENETVFFAA